jgi:hypothetical protein
VRKEAKQGRKKKQREHGKRQEYPFTILRETTTVRMAKHDVSHRSPWLGA